MLMIAALEKEEIPMETELNFSWYLDVALGQFYFYCADHAKCYMV